MAMSRDDYMDIKEGQLFKNSPQDDKAIFKLVSITDSPGGVKYYTMQLIDDETTRMVLHESELFPYQGDA